MPPSDAELAAQTLVEEGRYRFASFSSADAVTLGLSLRKRFRSTSRHSKGKGLVISIQTIAGHTLFACTVGDLGDASGICDVSLDSWACLESMIDTVRRTGHSSFYVEKGMSAMGKAPQHNDMPRVKGGVTEPYQLVSTTIRDYLAKLRRNSQVETPAPTLHEQPVPTPHRQESREWLPDPPPASEFEGRANSPFNHHEEQ
ncbi:hypothetical protein CVT26_000880 [Gymnopilus dilepis]|uniref:Uncharacterized protein n=1 Tax=Gymnopilus dilepis TaxID=231916 RepID=A0A409YLI0_9AGAR|nr:hypothetical protein CVT26_000880 [Gymnopilus dilepis]